MEDRIRVGIVGATVTPGGSGSGARCSLALKSKSVNFGPRHLELGIGEMKPILPPAGMPQRPAVNVARAYARYATARRASPAPAPDFGHAAVRHALIDALERSYAEGKVIKLG